MLRYYKLIQCVASKTGSYHRKMSQMSSKFANIPSKKRGFDSETYANMLDSCARNDNSTALSGKRDVKSMKKIRFLEGSLNNYLSNLYQKLKTEKPNSKVSFANFLRMKPAKKVLANFINRWTCLRTQHQHVAIKLKMLKTHSTLVPIYSNSILMYSSNIFHPIMIFERFSIYVRLLSTITNSDKRVKLRPKPDQARREKRKKKKFSRKTKKPDFEEDFQHQITLFRLHTKG